MGKCCFLCFLQIQEQCTGGNDPAVIISDPETFQISYVKMLFQGFLTQLVVKVPGIQSKYTDPKTPLQIRYIHTA